MEAIGTAQLVAKLQIIQLESNDENLRELLAIAMERLEKQSKVINEAYIEIEECKRLLKGLLYGSAPERKM